MNSTRSGYVTLRDFDQGVVETLGGVVVEDLDNGVGYYLPESVVGIESPLPDPPGSTGGVSPPSGLAGIPIIFSFPEDLNQKYKLPMLLVRRDGIDPAQTRWHPFMNQYYVPAAGANKVAVNAGTTANPNVVTGYDRWESQQQAIPYDLTYTIRIVSRYRGATGQSNHVNALLMHVMKVYQPYTRVLVKDSLGETRSYEGFSESLGSSDEGFEVANRVVGFDVSLRVEAELDLNDPQIGTAVIQPPSFRFKQP